MKKKLIALTLALSFLMLICSGCSTDATMPYSSAEYENGDWTFDELIEHFKELGFTDFDTYEFTTYDESEAKINRVAINDESFEKGDQFTPLIDEVLISATTLIPTLRTDNCNELKELVQMGKDSPEEIEKWDSFMNSHIGEYLMFDGSITDWNDDYFYVAVDLSVSVKGTNDTIFSWSNLDLIDTKLDGDYHYEKYHTGLIKEGMNVHMVVKIVSDDDEWNLEIEEMEIVE